MTSSRSLPSLQLSQDQWLHSLVQPPALQFGAPAQVQPALRLIRLDEINEEGHQAYRQALANVYASLNPSDPVRLLYLLDGSPQGIALYFGVVADSPQADLHEAMLNLRSALEGQLPGVNFGEEVPTQELLQQWQRSRHHGVMLGAPTAESDETTAPAQEQSFQGIDRLVRALQSGVKTGSTSTGRWQLTVVSQPLLREHIRKLLDEAYALSSQMAALVRTSVQASGNTSRQKSVSTGDSYTYSENEGENKGGGKNSSTTDTKNEGKSKGGSSGSSSSSTNWGENGGTSHAKTEGDNTSWGTSKGSSQSFGGTQNTSLSDTSGSTIGITQEIANKRAQHLMDYVDKQLTARLQKGLTKGLFHTAVYLSADQASLYDRLKNTVRATFQGNATTLSPLEIHDLPANVRGVQLGLPQLQQKPLASRDMLFHSLRAGAGVGLGSLLTGEELAIVAGLPLREVPGIRRRKTVDFIVDLPDTPAQDALDLGAVVDKGRRFANNRVRLTRTDLNKHTFVTGVTGAGKTTTCLNLLLESGLPFLVIEPAKTEYRELSQHLSDIAYYRPNGDPWQSLRLNPFALLRPGQGIKSHASFVKNVFAAVFPMEASMPMMVEAAILAAYEEKGWDLDDNQYLPGGDPFAPQARAWPTMSDMIRKLDELLPTFGLGKEFEEKYRGSLVSRLRSLTDGTLGRVLDVPQSIDFQTLLQSRTVIELEELQSGEEKALMMALILGSLNQAIRVLHSQNNNFRQLTLVEEAHRLLSRPEPGDKAAAMAVESFSDMLAEVRKYGAGLIIADQIPAKLIPDVIKNTHTKIVHRLFAEDDRRAMGEAMMMDDDQRSFLPNLQTGEAVIFCGGWHGPTHAAIRNDRAQTDNQQHHFDLSAKGAQQLWQQRQRYHPLLCSLPWLGQSDDGKPEEFAQFVRSTRQALNHLLRLIGPEGPYTELACAGLQQWLQRWQPLAQAAQDDYQAWLDTQNDLWPDTLLAAVWMAVMLDANPTPKAEAKNFHPLYPAKEREKMATGCQLLLEMLTTHPEGKALRNSLLSPANERIFSYFIADLQPIKTF